MTDTSASVIMNPKLAKELRKGYRSAAMRQAVGGLLEGGVLSLCSVAWQIYFYARSTRG